MEQYINKAALVAEIEKRKKRNILNEGAFEEDIDILTLLDTFEVKEVELEIDNNNPKITAGTKIRSKVNPDVILSIISDDCHGDKFECSNGSVLSLKQIEKYYDIYIEEK